MRLQDQGLGIPGSDNLDFPKLAVASSIRIRWVKNESLIPPDRLIEERNNHRGRLANKHPNSIANKQLGIRVSDAVRASKQQHDDRLLSIKNCYCPRRECGKGKTGLEFTGKSFNENLEDRVAAEEKYSAICQATSVSFH